MRHKLDSLEIEPSDSVGSFFFVFIRGAFPTNLLTACSALLVDFAPETPSSIGQHIRIDLAIIGGFWQRISPASRKRLTAQLGINRTGVLHRSMAEKKYDLLRKYSALELSALALSRLSIRLLLHARRGLQWHNSSAVRRRLLFERPCGV
jgi:hypothetical protein